MIYPTIFNNLLCQLANEQVSASTPASLFVGARLLRHYRFVGEIWNVIFFNSVINSDFVGQLQMDYPMLIDPIGECVPYLTMDESCPTPSIAPSLLCTSTFQMWVHNIRPGFTPSSLIAMRNIPLKIQCFNYCTLYGYVLRCDPSLRCLPDINDLYTCQPSPVGEESQWIILPATLDAIALPFG